MIERGAAEIDWVRHQDSGLCSCRQPLNGVPGLGDDAEPIGFSESAGVAVVFFAPVIAGAATWLVTDLTTSVEACARAGGSGVGLVGYIGLVLLSPLATGLISWRQRMALRPLMTAMLLSTMLGVLFIYIGLNVWWLGHNCYS